MRLLCASLLFLRVQAEAECSASLPGTANASTTSSGRQVLPQLPRSSHVLADIVGLDEAKAVLQEAVVLPLKMADDMARLFWRSSEQSAVLLAGPDGLGKRAAAEAVGAAVGGHVLNLLASEAREVQFCRIAMSAVSESAKPMVVIVEALETAPEVSLSIRNCLREATSADGQAPKLAIVATASADPAKFLRTHELALFGYFVQLGPPSLAERKQFLLKLLAQVSRLDAHWGSALRESAVETLANITDQYTFTEIDFVVRRAFLRSSNAEGTRDPVALHHFEKILAETPPRSVRAFKAGSPVRLVGSSTAADSSEPAASEVVAESSEATSGQSDSKSKKKKNSKDPMESIFGWCNFWLPEQLHLPPVVWAMIVFGILAHLMARTTYQPYNHRRRRGGPGGRSGSLFGDMGDMGGMGGMGGMGAMGGMGEGNPYSSFGDQLGGDWPLGGNNPFSNFPPASGMPGLGSRGDGASMFGSGSVGGGPSTDAGAAPSGGSSASSASASAAKD